MYSTATAAEGGARHVVTEAGLLERPRCPRTLANSSCCCLRSSSSGMPRFSRRELAFLLFRATVLHSWRTSFTSVMYDAKPRLSRAVVRKEESEIHLNEVSLGAGTLPPQRAHANTEQDSPLMTCSGEMVFLSDLLHISLASEEMRWMNSVQQFTTSSLASLATRTLGRVSLIILLIAALGMVRSSSFPEEEAIAADAPPQTDRIKASAPTDRRLARERQRSKRPQTNALQR